MHTKITVSSSNSSSKYMVVMVPFPPPQSKWSEKMTDSKQINQSISKWSCWLGIVLIHRDAKDDHDLLFQTIKVICRCQSLVIQSATFQSRFSPPRFLLLILTATNIIIDSIRRRRKIIIKITYRQNV